MAFYRAQGVTSEPDIIFLKTATISKQEDGSLTFESLTVSDEWLNTYMIVARPKSLRVTALRSSLSSVLDDPSFTYSVVDGHPTISWTKINYSGRETVDEARIIIWPEMTMDFFAIKIPAGYTP